MFGGGADLVPQRRAQSPNGLHSALDDPEQLARSQLELGVTRQGSLDTGLSAGEALDGDPVAGIGVYYSGIADDAFREAVFPESQDLIEDLVGEAVGIAALAHTVDQPALERLQAPLALPGRHGAAQAVRLARREAGGDDRELHDLLLENRHAERALEHALDGLARIAHRLLVVAAAQVRMHHLTLNRTRPHDGHFDDEVVEVARLEA